MTDEKNDRRPATPSIFGVDETAQPTELTPPVFDVANEDVPWSSDDVLPMDDDGNILPGGDDIDDDPNDTGETELEEIQGLPTDLPADEVETPENPLRPVTPLGY